MSGSASRSARPIAAAPELAEARNRIGAQVWRSGCGIDTYSRINLGNLAKDASATSPQAGGVHLHHLNEVRPRQVKLWLDRGHRTISLPARSADCRNRSDMLSFDEIREAAAHHWTIEGSILSRWTCKLAYLLAKFDD